MDNNKSFDFIDFYSTWTQKKTTHEINYDLKACAEKLEIAGDLLNDIHTLSINSVLEIGCGFGENVYDIVNKTNASFGLGCDISDYAIEYANRHYENDRVKYIKTPLDFDKAINQIRCSYSKQFDLLILFDVLEHIPQPKALICKLASLSKYFLINLPLDNTFLHNYILKKGPGIYPSSLHPDGHLWEFNTNNVHHFIVSLGLTPIKFKFYQHGKNIVYPSHMKPSSFKGKICYECLKMMYSITRWLVPIRMRTRIFNGGSFMCLANWSSDLVLE